MSTLKVNELDTKSGTVITVAAGKTLNVTLADDAIGAAQIADDAVGTAQLSATGTASATTYLSGANTWGTVVTSPVGAGTDKVFFENEMTVDTNYTVTASKNAMSAGIVTVADGVTVTLSGTSIWTIV